MTLTFQFHKKFKTFNWNVGDGNPMDLIKIKFTCEVMFSPNWAVYLNDAKLNNEPEDRTNIEYVVTGNKTNEVKLALQKGILPTTGGQPFNDVWIEFDSSKDDVKVENFWWATRKGNDEISKKADKNNLEEINRMLQQFPF